jgi:hypothetical protein
MFALIHLKLSEKLQFLSDFNNLSDVAKQYVVKNLNTLISKMAPAQSQGVASPMMNDHMASTKKTLFKLA